ncbi:MAG: SHOCT domain-containing protein, partial [Anaerolineales bacterium]|nr:SHOCT domain-containing protein [Anaerolineales bacterium]
KEMDSTMSFLQENEVPMAGILCSTPDIEYYNDNDNHFPPDGPLWLTGMRLVFAYKTGGGFFKTPESHFLEYRFSSLASIKHVVKGTLSKESWLVLNIFTTSAVGKVINVSFKLGGVYYKEHKEVAEAFVNSVKQHQKGLKSKSEQPTQPQDDLMGKLEQLNQFWQDGILTEEEFKAAKMRLLGM